MLSCILNLGLNLNYLGLFIANFVHIKLFFTLQIFNYFYSEINKRNIYNNTIDISSFQNGLNNLFSKTGFYLKSKVIEGSHKAKNVVSVFGHFFSKCTYLRS